MKPKTANLNCYRGETFRRVMTFRTTDGDIIDLTGATCEAQIRRALNVKQLVAEFNCRVNGPNGSVTMELSAPVTAEIAPGNYMYDMKITYANSDVKYYVAGKFVVAGSVTR